MDTTPAPAPTLRSRQVSRLLYGAVVGLALVVGLQDHPPSPSVMLATVVATAVAVGAAEFYGEFIAREIQSRRLGLRRAALRRILGEVGATMLGAGYPAVFFALAAVGVLSDATAFTVAKWSGLGLMVTYGFAAGRVAGATVRGAVVHAAVVGSIGALLIAVKSLLH